MAFNGRFLAGVNLPTLNGAYNHDLAPNERYPDWPCDFEPMLAYRYLAVCRQLGFQGARIWLCENQEGIVTDKQGRICGLHPSLLEAIRCIQEGADLANIQLYWTLLDANSWQRNGDTLTARICSDDDELQRFLQHVAHPIIETLNPEQTFALEFLNEPESLTEEVHPGQGLPWSTVRRAVRNAREAMSPLLPNVPITAGGQAVFLPSFLADWTQGEAPPPVDAIDLHVYHIDGGLPSRSDLPVDTGDLPLFIGEAGPSSDATHSESLIHYLYNAADLGYQAVFLWQLQGPMGCITGTPRSKGGRDDFFLTTLGHAIQKLLAPSR